MERRHKIFYSLLFLFYTFGILWLLLKDFFEFNYSGCLIKEISGFPCPSCGNTRSVISFFKGNIKDSLILNPIGTFISIIFTIILPISVYDVLFSKQVTYKIYDSSLKISAYRYVKITFIVLVLINWFWNIKKF